MKKILFTLSVIIPVSLFASDANVETDILERTVNFFIFAAIIYYLLSDKLKAFFVGRTEFDSPDVDNEVLIDATKHYVQVGKFANIKITSATEFDLYGEPV